MPDSSMYTHLCLAIALYLLPATPARAQNSSAVLRGGASAITTRGIPDHVLIHARNTTDRLIVVRLRSAHFLGSHGVRIGLNALCLRDSAGSVTRSLILRPGADESLWLHFDYGGGAVPSDANRFEYEVRFEVDGRRIVVRSTVVRATRVPVRGS